MSIIKNLLAVIAGIATFALLIMAIEWISHQVYPPPDIDFSEPDQIRAFMSTIPVGAILFIGLAWMAGAFCGTIVASYIGTLKPLYFGIIIGGLVLAGSITNLLIIPHPVWFTVAAPIAVILATYAAVQLLTRLKP